MSEPKKTKKVLVPIANTKVVTKDGLKSVRRSYGVKGGKMHRIVRSYVVKIVSVADDEPTDAE